MKLFGLLSSVMAVPPGNSGPSGTQDGSRGAFAAGRNVPVSKWPPLRLGWSVRPLISEREFDATMTRIGNDVGSLRSEIHDAELVDLLGQDGRRLMHSHRAICLLIREMRTATGGEALRMRSNIEMTVEALDNRHGQTRKRFESAVAAKQTTDSTTNLWPLRT